MGEVCLKEEVIRPDRLDEVLDPDVLEPERGVDVVLEVLRGALLEILALVRGHLVPLVFRRLHDERNPATAALHGDQLQLRVAVEQAAHHEAGDHLRVGHVHERRHRCELSLRAERAPAVVVQYERLDARTDVEVDGQLKFANYLPKRVPVGLAVVRLAEYLRPVGERYACEVQLLLDPPGLLERGVQVPEGEESLRKQPAAGVMLPLGDGVVVDLSTGDAHLFVFDVQESGGAEAARVGIDDLGVYPHPVHHSQARLDQIGGFIHLLERRER